VDTEESRNVLREDPACLLFRIVFDWTMSIEIYALYVWRLCKTINYNILYIKYVERISSSVCVLSKYIMRYTSNRNEKILQKKTFWYHETWSCTNMTPISIFLSFSFYLSIIFSIYSLIYLTVLASFSSIFFFFIFFAHIYIHNARTLFSTCIFLIIFSRKIT